MDGSGTERKGMAWFQGVAWIGVDCTLMGPEWNVSERQGMVSGRGRDSRGNEWK